MNEREIVALYKQGKSLRTIAEKYGVSHEFIRNMLPENVIRKKKTKVSIKQVLSLYKKHEGSYQKVAKELGVERNYIYNIIVRYGEPMCIRNKEGE